LGRRYNTALLAVERNNHGYSVNENICSAEYPRIYVEMVPEPPGKPRKRYGWVTSNATRPKIIDNLIREVLEDSHGIRCRETLSEMMSFQRQDNGRMEADPGKFDDRVISIAIGKYLRQRIDLPDEGPSQNVDTGEAKTRRKSSRGWT
jgi:hypothetical protein